MRIIDAKFHIEGERIIKTSSNEPVGEDGEPLILFRARDYLALPMLRHYRGLCVGDGCNDYQLAALDGVIAKFEKYSEDRSEMMKQPGVTRGMPFVPKAK